MKRTFFNQCKLGCSIGKATQWLVSRVGHRAFRTRFGPLVCDHPGGHEQVPGEPDRNGVYPSEDLAEYSSEMNELIVESICDAAQVGVVPVSTVGLGTDEPMTAWGEWIRQTP